MGTVPPIKTDRVDRLEVRVYRDREALGAAAGADVTATMIDLLAQQGRIRMIFAAAASQLELLRMLTDTPGIWWSRVTAFHLDEYLDLPPQAPSLVAQHAGCPGIRASLRSLRCTATSRSSSRSQSCPQPRERALAGADSGKTRASLTGPHGGGPGTPARQPRAPSARLRSRGAFPPLVTVLGLLLCYDRKHVNLGIHHIVEESILVGGRSGEPLLNIPLSILQSQQIGPAGQVSVAWGSGQVH
jgi:hypothetical protein